MQYRLWKIIENHTDFQSKSFMVLSYCTTINESHVAQKMAAHTICTVMLLVGSGPRVFTIILPQSNHYFHGYFYLWFKFYFLLFWGM